MPALIIKDDKRVEQYRSRHPVTYPRSLTKFSSIISSTCHLVVQSQVRDSGIRSGHITFTAISCSVSVALNYLWAGGVTSQSESYRLGNVDRCSVIHLVDSRRA